MKKLLRTARRYRTVTIQAGRQTVTTAKPVSDDFAEALTKINSFESRARALQHQASAGPAIGARHR
jgi:hypothetical protein